MKRVISGEQNQNKLFLNDHALKSLSLISPRIIKFYENLCNIFIDDQDFQLSVDQLSEKLELQCEIITYKYEIIGGPICRQSSKKATFFHCFDCEKDTLTSICDECFSEGQHIGHNFRMYALDCYCDCGNESILKKDFFCSRHKQFKQPKQMEISYAKLMKKQVQFLFLLSFLCNENMTLASSQRRDSLLVAILSLLTKYAKDNYNYQKIIGEILINKFDECYKYRQESVLELLMVKINWSDKTMKAISKFLADMHAIYAVRQKVIIYYWNIINQSSKSLKSINKMDVIYSQFMGESVIIVNLLRKQEILPLYVRESINFSNRDQIARFNLVFQLYQKLSQSNIYSFMISQMLPNMEIWRLYNYKNNQILDKIVLEQMKIKYVSVLLNIVLALQKLENKKYILEKMMNESLSFLKQCNNDIMTAPKITFTLCIFAYYDFNLAKIREVSIDQIMKLTNNSKSNLEQVLSKTIFEKPSMIYNMQKPDRQLDVNPQLLLALQYLHYKIAFIIMNKFQRFLLGSRVLPLQSYFAGQSYLQCSSKCPNLQSKFSQTCELLLNIFYSFETQLPQIIVSNHFKRPSKDQIIQFYRQLCSINRELTKLNFKVYAQSWIKNEDCLKQFIIKQFGQYYKKQELKDHYYINVSFLSEFCKYFKVTVQQKNKRFTINLNIQRKNSELNWIFTPYIINLVDEFLKTIVKKMRNSLKYQDSSSNFIIELLLNLYLWTKSSLYFELLGDFFKGKGQQDEKFLMYKEIYKKIDDNISLMLTKSVSDSNNKSQSKQKKLQRLKQIKLQQQKCLQSYKQQVDQAEKNTSSETETCIICQKSNQQRLSYLCSLRISQNLMKNILNINNYLVLLTTCGHKVHFSCLASSVNARQVYSAQIRCFLCKRNSNIRIPIYDFYSKETQKQLRYTEHSDKKYQNFTKIMEEFLTIMSLATSQSQHLNYVNADIQISNFGHIISKTIILSIYFYFLSYPKFYITHMLPLLRSLCSLAKFFMENIAPIKFKGQITYTKNDTLAIVENIVEQIVTSSTLDEQVLQKLRSQFQKLSQISVHNAYNENTELQKLKLYILTKQPIKFNLHKRIDRLNFYKLPQDLVYLNRQTGYCNSCKQISSKQKICFFCGFKVCNKCKKALDNHIKSSHANKAIMIDLEFGQHYYFRSELNERCQSLYCNYIGETFSQRHIKPKEGEYLLDSKLYETMLTNGLLENMKELVQADSIGDGCIVQ